MRVNIMGVQYIPDQHLTAEYREVKMGPPLLSRILNSKYGLDKSRISKEYKLGPGHSYFFLDKNWYLKRRLDQIVCEMKERGIRTDNVNLVTDLKKIDGRVFKSEYWKDYEPDEKAIQVNLDRINQRISEKSPGWYRFWGRPIKNMLELMKARKDNSFIECKCCRAINIENTICWKCDTDLSSTMPSSFFGLNNIIKIIS